MAPATRGAPTDAENATSKAADLPAYASQSLEKTGALPWQTPGTYGPRLPCLPHLQLHNKRTAIDKHTPVLEQALAEEGDLPWYADWYEKTTGLPWHVPLTDPTQVPWLPHLPPEAKGSLYQWGWYLFTQTEEGKRGKITPFLYHHMRKPHVSLPFASPKSIKEHATVALCAAFAYSPLSIFIDLRAAVQCVDKATEHVLRFKNIKAITPSLVEHALDYICAAGCGRVMPHRAACYEDRQAFRYCSIACFEQHHKTLPVKPGFYMYWHPGKVDKLHWAEVIEEREETHVTPDSPTNHNSTKGSLSLALPQSLLPPQMPPARATRHSPSNAAPPQPPPPTRMPSIHSVPRSPTYNPTQSAPAVCPCTVPMGTHVQTPVQVTTPPCPTPIPKDTPKAPTETPTTPQSDTLLATPPSTGTKRSPTKAEQYRQQKKQQRLGAVLMSPDKRDVEVRQLTQMDLARIAELAGTVWVVASLDARPTLWHVRRRTLERVAACMGLPAVVVQSLLWVASERGDACGSLTALAQADPAGLSVPPELREPFRVWAALSELTGHLLFYTLSEAAICETLGAFVRSYKLATDASRVLQTVSRVCATCGALHSAPKPVTKCGGCMVTAFCGRECRMQHVNKGHCKLLTTEREWVSMGRVFKPSFLSDSVRQTKIAIKAKAIAAEYAQCAQTHPHLQRVAQVILPPCGERHPDSPAVVAAHEMLVCAAGLLEDKGWEEIMRVVEACV